MTVILHVTEGPHQGREYVFDRHDTFVVGRSPQVHLPVPDDRSLSREHFLIEINPPSCYLKDMGSTNGTKVNGVKVSETRLHDGDLISAGKCVFQIQVSNTRGALPKVHCRACGRGATSDVAVAARSGDRAIDWFCGPCREHRRKLPNAAPGYWIECRIGGGGMGEVFLARELATARLVAIKMMIPTIATGENAKLRFRREMDVLKDLRHPNIVAFYDIYEADGQYQLVMEYVEGQDARGWLSARPAPLSVGMTARIGVQLLSALEHAHDRGYIHRDIRPSNLLVTGSEAKPIIKLSDFGLAKRLDEAGFTGLTRQGDIGGSVGFISPDHIRDFRGAREPADLYSAGATLYYLISGQYPFLDFNPNRTNAYAIILEHPSVPLRVHRPDVPEGFERVLRKALEKQPGDRWKSASVMAAALRPFLEGPE